MKLMSKSIVSLFVLGLIACVDTRQINQEAAQSYRGVIQQAEAKGAIDTSSQTAKRIHTVFKKMKPYAEKANKTGIPFNWEITVVKADELNAWAMPGGKMMFYTGLVDQLKLTDDEIATVMGHEMAHALQEHGKKDQALNTVTGLAAVVGKIALESQGIASNALGFDAVDALKEFGLDRPFSRSQETEADEEGLFLMAEAGYNPSVAPNIWRKMAQSTGNSSGLLASIVSTHPTNADRQANLERLIPKAMEVYNASKGK